MWKWAEQSANAVSQIFDDLKKKPWKWVKCLENCFFLNLDQHLKKVVNLIIRQNYEQQSSIYDLESRSVRDNLIFSGIVETPDENWGSPKPFSGKTTMNIDDYITFERIHRMGETNELKTKPRNIVPKFSFFKTTFVRSRAPHKLQNTNIKVNEQFPPEIEERRKRLYLVLRVALQQHSYIRLVIDKFYIDGKLHNPEDTPMAKK